MPVRQLSQWAHVDGARGFCGVRGFPSAGTSQARCTQRALEAGSRIPGKAPAQICPWMDGTHYWDSIVRFLRIRLPQTGRSKASVRHPPLPQSRRVSGSLRSPGQIHLRRPERQPRSLVTLALQVSRRPAAAPAASPAATRAPAQAATPSPASAASLAAIPAASQAVANSSLVALPLAKASATSRALSDLLSFIRC